MSCSTASCIQKVAHPCLSRAFKKNSEIPDQSAIFQVIYRHAVPVMSIHHRRRFLRSGWNNSIVSLIFSRDWCIIELRWRFCCTNHYLWSKLCILFADYCYSLHCWVFSCYVDAMHLNQVLHPAQLLIPKQANMTLLQKWLHTPKVNTIKERYNQAMW